VLRGGSFNDNAQNLRGAYRNNNHPENDNHNIGFRVVWSAAGGRGFAERRRMRRFAREGSGARVSYLFAGSEQQSCPAGHPGRRCTAGYRDDAAGKEEGPSFRW
jgi:hypothetical protein